MDLISLMVITFIMGVYLLGMVLWAVHSRPEGKPMPQATHVILDLEGVYYGSIQARDIIHAMEEFRKLDINHDHYYVDAVDPINSQGE